MLNIIFPLLGSMDWCFGCDRVLHAPSTGTRGSNLQATNPSAIPNHSNLNEGSVPSWHETERGFAELGVASHSRLEGLFDSFGCFKRVL